jgi:HPt (histidine-containing phosphotransfer) domain-containing protein
MNDCISKPISLETLARVVEKTAMEADGTEELYRTVIVKKKRYDSVLTHGVDFDDMRQRYGDDDELVQAITASFVAEAYELRARLAEAFASGSRKKVASVAHAIKSSASSVSARALWQCADQLEHASNFEYEANLEPYHTQLLRQWDNTVDFLSRNSEATLQDSSEATTL